MHKRTIFYFCFLPPPYHDAFRSRTKTTVGKTIDRDQPLWLGGTQGENGITFIHTYPEVEGAQPISEEEGLYFSGDMESASRVVTDGPGSGFNFRFFAQVV